VKQEWKKSHKNLYGIKIEPVLLDVPAQQFIMIDGEGNPNAADFSERVGALYSLAYAVKMRYKKTAAGRRSMTLPFIRWKACGGRKRRQDRAHWTKTAWNTPS